jgi:hypothetical protein
MAYPASLWPFFLRSARVNFRLLTSEISRLKPVKYPVWDL